MAGFTKQTRFTIITCARADCGVQFAITEEYEQRRREDHKGFKCPNGHGNVYRGENEAERLKREKGELERELDGAYSKLNETSESLRETERSFGKMRQRLRNGLCPCCNRSFGNLRKHMETKHGGFGAPKVLRDVRAAYGMTQRQLSKELDVPEGYVSLFENEKPLPEWAQDVVQEWLDKQFTIA